MLLCWHIVLQPTVCLPVALHMVIYFNSIEDAHGRALITSHLWDQFIRLTDGGHANLSQLFPWLHPHTKWHLGLYIQSL